MLQDFLWSHFERSSSVTCILRRQALLQCTRLGVFSKVSTKCQWCKIPRWPEKWFLLLYLIATPCYLFISFYHLIFALNWHLSEVLRPTIPLLLKEHPHHNPPQTQPAFSSKDWGRTSRVSLAPFTDHQIWESVLITYLSYLRGARLQLSDEDIRSLTSAWCQQVTKYW